MTRAHTMRREAGRPCANLGPLWPARTRQRQRRADLALAI